MCEWSSSFFFLASVIEWHSSGFLLPAALIFFEKISLDPEVISNSDFFSMGATLPVNYGGA